MRLGDVGRAGLWLAALVADAAVAIPLMTGYVALGAGVLIGRSLLPRASIGSLVALLVSGVIGQRQIASSTPTTTRPRLQLVHSDWL